MPDDIVTPATSEQAEEFETPSEEVIATRLIPWVPVLAFAQIVCIFFIFFSVFTL